MTESDPDGKVGQYPFVQHELEIARRIGPGGGAPDAVRGGDDHIGYGQFFLGIGVALDYGTFDGNRQLLRNQAGPVRTQIPQQPNNHGGCDCDNRPD
jgi:hypothetical protein